MIESRRHTGSAPRTWHGCVCAALAVGCTLSAQAYSPSRAGASAPAATTPAPAKGKAAAAPAKLVDINSASLAELKTLPGIGDAEAARIVAARPYPSKAKLVADGVIGMAQFTQLKDRIEARQSLPAKKTPSR